MKVILNVDDLGMHPAVARAAQVLFEKGLVTSASVVANGPDVESAVRLNAEGVGIGVHLDIVRGRPVGHWQERSSIVDGRGVFLGSEERLFARYVEGRVEHEHVESEWTAQIKRVMDLGIQPTHLSSHGNVHAWPTLTRMAGDLAVRHGIGWLRTPDECSHISRLDMSAYREKFLNVCGLFGRRTAGVSWPDTVWGMDEPLGKFTADRFAGWARKRLGTLGPDGIIEICCRPGETVAGDQAISSAYDPTSIAAVWRDHLASMEDSESWFAAFKELGLELTNFGKL
jgi:hypothetical protein